MRPFDQLTEAGQARRLRRLAAAALAHYDLAVARIELAAVSSNTIYRVSDARGVRYALRVGAADQHSREENMVEVLWLSALAQATELRLSTPIPNRRGELITTVGAAGIPEQRRCVLFRWIGGRQLAEQITPQSYAQLGAIMATMHQHAAAFQLPGQLRPMAWDRVLYYGHDQQVLFDPAYAQRLSAEQQLLIAAVYARAERAIAELYAAGEPPMLIHGDLHPANVHVSRGRLAVLDFEDVLLGYPVQDVAITFYYRDYPEYAQLCAAFEQGYRAVRPWPARSREQIETLIAARALMMLNYALRAAPAYVDRIARRLHCYAEHYL